MPSRASCFVYNIVWRVNLGRLLRKFVGAWRTTTTNCKVIFIDLSFIQYFLQYLRSYFYPIFIPPYKHCNFTGIVLWYYHRAKVTCDIAEMVKAMYVASLFYHMECRNKPLRNSLFAFMLPFCNTCASSFTVFFWTESPQYDRKFWMQISFLLQLFACIWNLKTMLVNDGTFRVKPPKSGVNLWLLKPHLIASLFFNVLETWRP